MHARPLTWIVIKSRRPPRAIVVEGARRDVFMAHAGDGIYLSPDKYSLEGCTASELIAIVDKVLRKKPIAE